MIDKQTLLQKINEANITPQLKTDLLDMVNGSEEVNAQLLEQINAAIDDDAETIINEIADAEVAVHADEYNKQMQAVGKDVDEFVKELNKKADAIDMEEARAKVK